MSDSTRGAIYGISAAAIWGGLYVVSDVVLETIPPFTLLVIRLVIGLIILRLWGRLNLPPDRRSRLHLLGLGVLGFGVSVGAQFLGTDLSTAVNGALITSAAPAFILLFAALILHEKLSPRRIFAVLLATLGVLFIIDPRQANFSSETFWGDIALAGAALSWGLYSVLVRVVSRYADTLTVTYMAFLGGMVLDVPLAGLEVATVGVGTITPGIVLGVAYLGVISTAGAMWLWNRAFALVDANRASLFFFAQPIVGAVLGVLLLGQALTSGILIGGALILTGTFVSITE